MLILALTKTVRGQGQALLHRLPQMSRHRWIGKT